METRKVLEMGGGTVLISLPKGWARKNGIVKGSTVAVEELSPRRLLVHPLEGEGKHPREVVIDYPRESILYILNQMTGAYLLGYDVIRIQGEQVIAREDRERLKLAIGRLVGLEIMDEDARSITMHFLPEPSTLDPEKIVRRMASLTRGMLRDSNDGIAHEDKKILSLVSERDDEVDRLYFLLVRAIRTATIDPQVAETYHLTPVECLDYRVLASFLESLGDTVAEFSKRALEETLRREASKSFSLILGKLEEMEELAVRSFLARRTSKSMATFLELEEMEKSILEHSSRTTQMEGVSTRAMIDLLSLIERIAKIFMDISDLSLPTYAFQ